MAITSTVAVFGRSWRLFFRNLSIVLPGFVAAGVSAFAAVVVVPAGASASDAQIVFSHTLILFVQIVTTVIGIAITTGMADAAWRSERGTFGDGFLAFRREGRHVFVAVIALLVIGAIAAFLAPFTFAISLGLYAYCCLYTMPSAVVGERAGIVAIWESTKIAVMRPVATIVILVAVTAIAYASEVGAAYLSVTPYVGALLAQLVFQAVVAYATLVLVGEYRIARQMEPTL